MATNTSDIVHLSDSDDSDYQYEVQNLAQQVIHFIDNNNVTSSEINLRTMIHLTMNLQMVKMAKMVMEIACKYQFQTMSEIQNMKQILI